MKVTLMPGIESISGSIKNRSGRVIFKTYTKGKKRETRMYFRKYDSYKHRAPLTEGERAARVLFQKRVALVQLLLANGECKTKAEAWRIAKMQIV